MEIKLTEILISVQNGDIPVEEGKNLILDLFGMNKSSILKGGDGIGEYGERHRDDCERIKSILVQRGFINAGLRDALWLWGEYSDSYAAGWLSLPDEDEDVYNCIKNLIVTTHRFV